VFDEPPAPAARDEFGFDTVAVVARRLVKSDCVSDLQDGVTATAS